MCQEVLGDRINEHAYKFQEDKYGDLPSDGTLMPENQKKKKIIHQILDK